MRLRERLQSFDINIKKSEIKMMGVNEIKGIVRMQGKERRRNYIIVPVHRWQQNVERERDRGQMDEIIESL